MGTRLPPRPIAPRPSRHPVPQGAPPSPTLQTSHVALGGTLSIQAPDGTKSISPFRHGHIATVCHIKVTEGKGPEGAFPVWYRVWVNACSQAHGLAGRVRVGQAPRCGLALHHPIELLDQRGLNRDSEWLQIQDDKHMSSARAGPPQTHAGPPQTHAQVLYKYTEVDLLKAQQRTCQRFTHLGHATPTPYRRRVLQAPSPPCICLHGSPTGWGCLRPPPSPPGGRSSGAHGRAGLAAWRSHH